MGGPPPPTHGGGTGGKTSVLPPPRSILYFLFFEEKIKCINNNTKNIVRIFGINIDIVVHTFIYADVYLSHQTLSSRKYVTLHNSISFIPLILNRE